ncbi:MAG: LysR family transcriptional regulator [Devosia sp.]|uniref:LysR family transcriptional regulator n=1 Tax=Devosia sp. TaxID=1871048 RepID=UPI003394080E
MINDAVLRNIDLNLLLSFTVLMQERNVSRAAERLLVGQPGLSAALKRLRETLGDKLFVRVGRGLQPTARALAIAPAIEAALATIEQAIKPPTAFDPSTWQGEFRVSMCDNLESAFFGPLAARLQQLAPRARLVSVASDKSPAPQMLDECAFDLSISVHGEPASWHVKAPLFEQAMVSIYDPGQVRNCGTMGLDDFVALPHLAVSIVGSTENAIDRALSQTGRTRNVVATVQRFSGLPTALSTMPSIATVPETIGRCMARLHNLTVVNPPLPLPRDPVSLLYRRVDQADGRSMWFRQLLTQVAERVLLDAGCQCEVARAA